MDGFVALLIDIIKANGLKIAEIIRDGRLAEAGEISGLKNFFTTFASLIPPGTTGSAS